MNQQEYGQAQLLQNYNHCFREHPPVDVEKHARERLEFLERRIPEMTKELAGLAIEKGRLEKMLATLDPT